MLGHSRRIRRQRSSYRRMVVGFLAYLFYLTFFFFFFRFRRTGNREKIFLATKFGGTESGGIDGRPEHAKTAIENSLNRLGVERIDLYYLHVCVFENPKSSDSPDHLFFFFQRADKNVPIEVGASSRTKAILVVFNNIQQDTVKAMAEFVKWAHCCDFITQTYPRSQRRKSALPRPVRSISQHAPPRASRPFDRGRPSRVFSHHPRHRGRKHRSPRCLSRTRRRSRSLFASRTWFVNWSNCESPQGLSFCYVYQPHIDLEIKRRYW